MGKWNDTDVPLAYLITFRTYGTWLHGDERGSVDRFHNRYLEPDLESNIIREQQQTLKLKSEPYVLNSKARRAVTEAIEEACRIRKWFLYALNIRTNHGHIVIATVAPSGKILGDLKAYSTRKLRERACWTYKHSPWVDKGSRRKLWNDDHIARAVDYVINGQGDELPEFD